MKHIDDTQQILISNARAGNKRSAAAKASGIKPATLSSWIKKGLNGDEAYADFARDYLEAEGNDERMLVSTLKECLVDPEGYPVPSVAMFLLNNRYGWSKVASQIAEKFIDYLVGKLGEEHPVLLTSILEDLESGVLD